MLRLNKDSNADYECKVLIVGDKGVGKSRLFRRCIGEPFGEDPYESTIGVELSTKIRGKVPGEKIKFKIWDASGLLRFKDMVTKSYYPDKNVFLVVCDLTNKDSFENIQEYLQMIKQFNQKNAQIFLIGTKADLIDKCVVHADEFNKFKDEKDNPYVYIETSAKNDMGIEDIYTAVTRRMWEIPPQDIASSKEQQPSTNFFQRHWRKMLIGALLVGGIVAIGVFTGGIGIAAAAGAVAGAVVVGAVAGALVGKYRDKKERQSRYQRMIGTHTGKIVIDLGGSIVVERPVAEVLSNKQQLEDELKKTEKLEEPEPTRGNQSPRITRSSQQ